MFNLYNLIFNELFVTRMDLWHCENTHKAHIHTYPHSLAHTQTHTYTYKLTHKHTHLLTHAHSLTLTKKTWRNFFYNFLQLISYFRSSCSVVNVAEPSKTFLSFSSRSFSDQIQIKFFILYKSERVDILIRVFFT